MIGKKLSSGVKTSSSVIYTGPCYYYGFTCRHNKTQFDITLYDNTIAVGNIVEAYRTDSNKVMEGHSHSNPVVCQHGLYLDMSGLGEVVVYYIPHSMY